MRISILLPFIRRVRYNTGMTHLHEHRFLKCPYTRAKGYLREALESLAQNHKEKTITLSVPFTEGPATGTLHKDVLATYAFGADPMHFDQPWKIHWKPESGPYPEFDGELVVRADEDYTTSILDLRGEYRPPMGATGALFDAIAGSHIARATAQELLKNVGEQMEQRYYTEEQAKPRT